MAPINSKRKANGIRTARTTYYKEHVALHAAYRAAHAEAVKQFGDPETAGTPRENVLVFHSAIALAKRAVIDGMTAARARHTARASGPRPN